MFLVPPLAGLTSFLSHFSAPCGWLEILLQQSESVLHTRLPANAEEYMLTPPKKPISHCGSVVKL